MMLSLSHPSVVACGIVVWIVKWLRALGSMLADVGAHALSVVRRCVHE